MSAAPKFKVGDRVRFAGEDLVRTVVVAEPDADDRIVMADESGCYLVNDQDDYELVPTRYVVELRAPKKGERYVFRDAVVEASYDYDSPRAVIVDEVTS